MQYHSQKAYAADDKTITLICRQDETVLSGMEWSLYRIGDRDGSTVRFAPALSGYSMDLGDLSSETVDAAAKTIEGYVIAAGVAPLAQGSTDTAGELVFGGLDNGLYLAAGKNLLVGNTCYVPSTLLIEVRNTDASLDYDAYPKFYYTDVSGQQKQYTVKKVWIDSDNQAQKRPDDLTIDLYQDGVLHDTVILNAENSWEYTWSAEDDGTEWRAVEREVPAEYTVMIDYNSSQFLIRNSYNPPETTAAFRTTVTTATTAAAVTTTTTATTAATTSEAAETSTTVTFGGPGYDTANEHVLAVSTSAKEDDADADETETEPTYTPCEKVYNWAVDPKTKYLEPELIKDDECYYVVVKLDIEDRMTDDDQWTSGTIENVRQEMYYDTFLDKLDSIAKDLPVTRNASAFRRYKVLDIDYKGYQDAMMQAYSSMYGNYFG